MTPFVHLRTRSAYSVLEGAIPVKALVKLAKEGGFPAIALTDANNMFGALEFAETAAKEGIQPIPGCLLPVAYAQGETAMEKAPPPAPLTLLAQDERGYLNLMRLTSRAHIYPDSTEAPHARWADLEELSEGIVCLTGGPDGPAGRLLRQGRREEAFALLDRLRVLFAERLYVELHRHGDPGGERRLPEEAQTEAAFLDWAYDRGEPIVAVNDVFFADRSMHVAHDALRCIAESRYVTEEDRDRLTPEHHLKSGADMAALFDDLPEAVEATVEVARRCAYRPTTIDPILPRFAEDEVAELRRQSREGLDARLAANEPCAPREEYDQRLDYELSVIERMGFPGYFLIVADFIKWAKAQDIPVGPGRGSGAGSIVAWALTITDLDPLRYGLLFERFLNPDRISMPDFDIDFCMDRREEVIRYVQERYGKDRVAQIITFGTLQSKATVRDVGRVLQMPFGQVDRLAKMIPVEGVKPVPIERARVQEPRLAEEIQRDETVRSLMDIGQQIEGLLRNASTHAAGVVIGDRPLWELLPLYRDPRSDMPVTQFNMKWVEPAGLVKFDFLGLKTLTILQGAIDLIREHQPGFDLAAIPLDCEETFALYGRAETVGVFQVESAGMREALRLLQPTCIEDIIALVALYRPGPMENIPKYCNVKNGREARERLHPLIDDCLDETQGIIVYQEQVMEIARRMAGYSLAGADELRRAMGKKIQAEMDKQRPIFLEGAGKNGVDEAKAVEIWNLLDKFANYGFNKAHAAAYGLVSYQTAWLKTHHPVEFMAAVMNNDLAFTDKLAVYKQALAKTRVPGQEEEGIPLLPPDVNASDALFKPDRTEDGRPAIRYALGGLRNVGREAMAGLVKAREGGRPFRDVFDALARIDPRHLNKRTLENLAKAGAFDRLDGNRRRLVESADVLLGHCQLCASERGSAQGGLFGSDPGDIPPPRLAAVAADWGTADRLAAEREAVGFYLTGHPLDDFAPALKRKRFLSHAEVERMATAGRPVSARIAGTVIGRDERKSARGNRFAFVQLSDASSIFEVMVFSEVLAQARPLLEAGTSVALTVEAKSDGGQVRMQIVGVQTVEEATADAAAKSFEIIVRAPDAIPSLEARLRRAETRRSGGPIRLVLDLAEEDCEVEVALPGDWDLSPKVRAMLQDVEGVEVREV